MCRTVEAYFKQCGHSSWYSDPTGCPEKDCEIDRLSIRSEDHETQDGICLTCMGVYEPFFYKHCYNSLICFHDFDHVDTEIQQELCVQQEMLVTPSNELCHDCQESGYDTQPGGSNPPPLTASIVPPSFMNVSRVPVPSRLAASFAPKPPTLPPSYSTAGGSSAWRSEPPVSPTYVSRVPSSGNPLPNRPRNHPSLTGQSVNRYRSQAPPLTSHTMAAGMMSPIGEEDSAVPNRPPRTAASYLARGSPKNISSGSPVPVSMPPVSLPPASIPLASIPPVSRNSIYDITPPATPHAEGTRQPIYEEEEYDDDNDQDHFELRVRPARSRSPREGDRLGGC